MGGYGAAALSAVGVTSGIVAGGTAAAAGVTEGVKRAFGNKKANDADDADDDDYDYEYSDDDDDESYSDEKRNWRRKRRQARGGEEDENSDDESEEDDEDSNSSSIDPSEGLPHSPNPKGPPGPQPYYDAAKPDSGPSDRTPPATNDTPPAGSEDGSDTYEKMLKRVQARRQARSQN